MHLQGGNGGWQHDCPDHRDYTLAHPAVQKLWRRLKEDVEQPKAPTQVDWREYCGPIEEQGRLPTSAAHATVAMLQYFVRRCTGKFVRPSRLFVHFNAAQLLHQTACGGTSLRAALQAIAAFGGPDEEYWPYHRSLLRQPPSAFAFAYSYRFKRLKYMRLDSQQTSPEQLLRNAKAFLAAGFPLAFGFAVPDTFDRGPEIAFPTVFDRVRNGTAVLAVGYDDDQRIHSDKGALLIRNSWGEGWGDNGYGWLPYRYLTAGLARDFWTLLKPSWLKSGELFLPQVGEK